MGVSGTLPTPSTLSWVPCSVVGLGGERQDPRSPPVRPQPC